MKFINPEIDYSKFPADIRYNEAIILKEDCLIKKKKNEEEKRLNHLLIDKIDSKEFDQWRRESDKKDELERYELLAKRKVALEIAREDVTNNLELRILRNKKKVLIHKQEEAKKFKEKKAQNIEEIELKRKIVLEIKKDDKENAKYSKEMTLQQNKENYLNYQEEKNNLIFKGKEEKKYEDEKRNEIIRQIRELEKIPVNRSKGFDPTEVCNI